MKIALAALLLAVPLVARAAGPDTPKADPHSLIDHPAPPGLDLSGGWQIKGDLSQGGVRVASATPACDFQQTNATLKGRCKGPNAEGPASGVVVGRGHVSWRWDATAKTLIGVSSIAYFEGDVGPDGVIRGTWKLSQAPDASGAFTQTRR